VEKRQEPHWSYSLSRRLYPVLRLFGKSFSVKSTELGEAMFRVGINGHVKEVLENRDIMRVLEERR